MLNDLSVRSKLTVAFGGLALLMLFVATTALMALNRSDQAFTEYVHGVDARAKMSAKVQHGVARRAIAARNLVLVTSPQDLQREHRIVERAHEEVTASLAELNAMISSASDTAPAPRQLVARLSKIEAVYGPVALRIVNLAVSGQRDQAIQEMNEKCLPLLNQLNQVADEYADLTNKRAANLVLDAGQRFTEQRNVLVGICVAAFLFAAAAGWWITRSLFSSLGCEPSVLKAAAQRVAAGDLVRDEMTSNVPQASVLASLGSMQDALARLVGQVRESSSCIAVGSEQIANGSAHLSQRTEEQASSLQQTAATMDELSSTVRRNADNARQASSLAAGARDVAVQGGDVVDRVVHTMQAINDSSRKISDIIAVIDGIAFQTNILALNAAVEAARAGEQGRGFAVVAGEVRSLAQRSATAAREIKSLITASVEQVGQGSELVAQAGATMQEIVKAVHRVSDVIVDISSASVEQSTGVEQVGQAVNQIDQVTQQNAGLVEESAAAAESLKHQAQQLVSSVSVFKLAPA